MKRTLTTASLLFLVIVSALACFWDTDTLAMERQQFPSVLELLSGKFLRHSPEYHYWRIRDREKRIEKHPEKISLYDDLAVSLSKIGDDTRAIKVIKTKDSIAPGLYETYANLGTFYIHNGQLDKGIVAIDKAIEINPEAHFGREIYQRHVAEYVLKQSTSGKVHLPMSRDHFIPHSEYREAQVRSNFYTFLDQKIHGKNQTPTGYDYHGRMTQEELDLATLGVLGMMKFGNHNSPILLEILGDLLLNDGRRKTGARQLAARAYLKASYQVPDSNSKMAYLNRVNQVINLQLNKPGGAEFNYTDLETLFAEELQEGMAFYDSIRSNEINWIQSGANPEQKFTETYYQEPWISTAIQPAHGKNKALRRGLLTKNHLGSVVDFRPLWVETIDLDDQVITHVDKKDNEPTGGTEVKNTPEGNNQSASDKKQNATAIILGVAFFALWMIWRIRRRGLS
ncbi:MAG: hypothetical protein JJ975_03230 [Bacteroidia bacterium]|nr:hypothetical protein [Bacteroidia bacterium]